MDNVPFTAHEELVWEQLWMRRGAEYAVPIRVLSERTGLSAREVKGAVADLILRHNLRIGSSRRPPEGYYLITTAEELLATVRPLRSQAIQMFRRISALEGRPARRILRELLGQMKMEECA